MGKFKFVLALCLLVGAAEIHGVEVQPPELVSITAPDVTLEPIFDHHAPPQNQTNGVLLTSEQGCGYSPYGAPRIVGGGPARNGAYPWIALLGYCPVDLRPNYGTTFRCGSSLITSRHILTAAHCLSPDLWFARLGEHDQRHEFDGPHQDIEIAEVYGHEDYDRQYITSDIAVLKLRDDAIFGPRVRPVCLPILDDTMRGFNFKSTNPFVAGWGNTKEGGYNVSPYLKHVQVAYVDVPDCRDIYMKNGFNEDDANKMVSEQNVCAGVRQGQSSCQGDSGGPLTAPVYVGNGKFPFYQLGAVSWAMGCARTPTVYASVQHFGDWIKSKLVL